MHNLSSTFVLSLQREQAGADDKLKVCFPLWRWKEMKKRRQGEE